MSQVAVKMTDGRDAIIETKGHTGEHIKCSIEGGPFQMTRKSNIAPTRRQLPKWAKPFVKQRRKRK